MPETLQLADDLLAHDDMNCRLVIGDICVLLARPCPGSPGKSIPKTGTEQNTKDSAPPSLSPSTPPADHQEKPRPRQSSLMIRVWKRLAKYTLHSLKIAIASLERFAKKRTSEGFIGIAMVLATFHPLLLCRSRCSSGVEQFTRNE